MSGKLKHAILTAGFTAASFLPIASFGQDYSINPGAPTETTINKKVFKSMVKQARLRENTVSEKDSMLIKYLSSDTAMLNKITTELVEMNALFLNDVLNSGDTFRFVAPAGQHIPGAKKMWPVNDEMLYNITINHENKSAVINAAKDDILGFMTAPGCHILYRSPVLGCMVNGNHILNLIYSAHMARSAKER